MDFGSALTYQFRDPRWMHKCLMAALLSLIPVIGQVFVLGWALEITRRVIDGASELLPEVDLPTDLLRGLKGWGINLVYALPAILVTFPLALGIGLLIATRDSRAAEVWGLALLCLTVGLIAYSLLLGFVLPATYAVFIAQGEHLSAGLNFRRVYSLLRGAPVAYFMVFIGGLMCALITFIGLAGCIIGVVLTATYSLTVQAHLYGQAYRESVVIG